VVGAGEYDYAQRDLRYTTVMFSLLTADREFADYNKDILQRWLSTWTERSLVAARKLQPLWSQSDARPPRFEDALDTVKNRFNGILTDLDLQAPAELSH
jgi:propane monooxygenase small subunit